MTIDSRNQLLKTIRQRKYLNKDFDGFKTDLYDYARVYYGDRIKDFSESSLGGLFLEMAAYVGDVQSFYLDHQFHELSADTAVEPKNIQNQLRQSNVAIVGASPAICNITFMAEVPVTAGSNPPVPDPTALPNFVAGTTSRADTGIEFELVEDIDFGETSSNGALRVTQQIGARDTTNQPRTFILSRKGLCVSGFRNSESFSVGSFEAFKKFTLSKENITEIISVRDSLGNVYYEVDFLTQDTIFQAITSRNNDNELVKDTLILSPAPYRFVKAMDIDTRLTTLTFGGGSAESMDDDIVPDPSEFALPLYGKRSFSRFTLNPGNLLRTSTLGVVGVNCTITIEYRYGGGLSHNVSEDSIHGFSNLVMTFPRSPTPSVSQFVRSHIDAVSEEKASGGDDAPTLDELKLRIPASRAAQSRIVSKPDLLARVYTLPNNFGRVFRAALRQNPNNPLSSNLFIISRDINGRLTVSPDTLKKNLQTYLNQFRLISDALDILDAQVVNLQVQFAIVVDPSMNKNLVLQNVISKLKQYFDIKHYEIDQPIVLDDLRNIIFNNQGVVSLQSLRVNNVSGIIGTRDYSDIQYDVNSNTFKGLLIPPPGGIFEIKFFDNDLQGVCI